MSLSHSPCRLEVVSARRQQITRLKNRRLLSAIEHLEQRVVLAVDLVEGGWLNPPVYGPSQVELSGEIFLSDPAATTNSFDVTWSVYKDYTWKRVDPDNGNYEYLRDEFGNYVIESTVGDGLDIDFDGTILDPLFTTIDSDQVNVVPDEDFDGHFFISTQLDYPSSDTFFQVIMTVTNNADLEDVWTTTGQFESPQVGLSVEIDPLATPALEGSPVELTASSQSAALLYQWNAYKIVDGVPELSPTASSTDANFAFVPADDGQYQVILQVEEFFTGHTAATQTIITVGDVAPTIAASGPTAAIPGLPISYSATTTQASVDTIATSWKIVNSASQVIASGSGTAATYTPTANGTYNIEFTVVDDDNSSATQTIALTVSNSIVIGGQLLIGASAGGSNISLTASAGGLSVTVNGVTSPLGAGITAIDIFGQGGNDTFIITGNISVPITIDAGAGNDNILIGPGVTSNVLALGGAGNDIIIGGNGHNILVGGDGNDALTGGGQRDLLIGGDGVDILLGNSQDDILIAGMTDYDNSPQTLRDILALWLLNTSFTSRVNSLSGLLNDSTVHDDGDIDILMGLGGNDWFLANRVGGSLFTRDLLLDASGVEINNRLEL